MTRHAAVQRETAETDVRVELTIAGSGEATVNTGVGLYDHLLTSLLHHGLFDASIETSGDLHVDEHHTVEDTALVLGEAFDRALGDRAGIRRYGDATVPMDEALAHCAVDVGGRPYWSIDLAFRGRADRDARHPDDSPRSRGICAHRSLHDPSHGNRPQRSPHRRGRLQGAGPGAAVCRRTGSRDAGCSIDQGHAVTTIAVVDHGAGNLVSIGRGLEAAGARVAVATDPERVLGCRRRRAPRRRGDRSGDGATR